jgi:hypothetical protein
MDENKQAAFADKMTQILNGGALSLALAPGMMWARDQAVSLLREAGFEHIQVLQMSHDPFNVHYQCA